MLATALLRPGSTSVAPSEVGRGQKLLTMKSRRSPRDNLHESPNYVRSARTALQLPLLAEAKRQSGTTSADKQVTMSAAGPAASATAPFPPFAWKPVQKNSTSDSDFSEAPSEAYFAGTFVNNLSLDLDVCVEADATQPMYLDSQTSCKENAGLQCCVLGNSLVLCKGVAFLSSSEDVATVRKGWNVRIAQLPEGKRPEGNSPLQYAGAWMSLSGHAGVPTSSPQLVTLVLLPDGWIFAMGLLSKHCAIDLSAIRFCLGRSVGLIDRVRLTTCVLAGRRFISLQGDLEDAAFKLKKDAPLVQVPESSEPAQSTPFVVCGSRSGSFHLVFVRRAPRLGVGGDLRWLDSTCRHDAIHLSGVLYEVAADALRHPTMEERIIEMSNAEGGTTLIRDFQRQLIRTHGSIENAWYKLFARDGSNSIKLAEFFRGCKAAGYCGNPVKMWAVLDYDGSGEITREELGRQL